MLYSCFILLEVNINTLLISGSSGIIVILLGIIGYFIAQRDKRQAETNKELSYEIKKLSGAISGLNALLGAIDVKVINVEKNIDEHKKYCEKKFSQIKL